MIVRESDIIYHRIDHDVSQMKESRDYKSCPYCGAMEFGIENVPFKPGEYFKRYEVNGTKYPYEANMIGYSDEFASTHYGVTMEWNEIHCCKGCKKEYYTVHQH